MFGHVEAELCGYGKPDIIWPKDNVKVLLERSNEAIDKAVAIGYDGVTKGASE